MERDQKKLKSLHSKRKDARGLLKKCFKKGFFSLVPLEIWVEVISFSDIKSMAFLAQTCWAFKELVELIGEKSIKTALLYRKEGQITLALKYLERFAENGNGIAMLHLGVSYWFGGSWGLQEDKAKAASWFKKLAEQGTRVVPYAFCLRFGYGGVEKDEELGEALAKKTLGGTNLFDIGLCHNFGFGTEVDKEKAFEYFQCLRMKAVIVSLAKICWDFASSLNLARKGTTKKRFFGI